MSILDAGPRAAFDRFEQLLRAEGFDATAIVRAGHLLMAFYGGNEIVRDALRAELSSFLDLERRWYESLVDGEPDFAIYSEPIYLADAIACWLLYSRGYLRSMERYGLRSMLDLRLGGVGVVADLGCGIGFTTLGLAELFPGARVYGTNVLYSPQARIAERAGVDVRGEPGEADLVVALEYFEHFEEPLAHLRDVLDRGPRALVLSNTFGPRAPGHFEEYLVGDERVEPRRAARALDAELRARGFGALPTRMWNGRPTYWVADFDLGDV